MRAEAEAIGRDHDARGARIEEFIGALRALWADDLSTYQGEHARFDRVRSYPKPVADKVSIVVGARSVPGGPARLFAPNVAVAIEALERLHAELLKVHHRRGGHVHDRDPGGVR